MARQDGGRFPRVGIVGAGLGGIATAVNLERSGIHDFLVFEKSAGPGGTWWDNTYPGCEVDVESHAYSFSFFPYDWSGTHAKQPELQRYAEDTIDRFGLRSRFRFGAGVASVTWDDAAQLHRLVTTDGEAHEFDVVVSCLGMLNVPKLPGGLDREVFEGPSFHTARWEHEHDLAGRRVGFIGTGSTGAQVVAAIAPEVAELHVFQREPGWVVPKGERTYTDAERAKYMRFPILQRLHRWRFFYKYFRMYKGYDATSKVNHQLRDLCLQHIERSISDPELRALVTPQYAFGCKRNVQSSDYYSALDRDNVSLHPHEVVKVTETGVVTDDGQSCDLDVLIYGTGFETTKYLSTLEVVGAGGRSLHDEWNGDPSAFLGMTVPGFPNFFMLYGPNTNGGAIIIQLERQAEVVARTMKRMRRRRSRTVDTRRVAFERYLRWIDKRCVKHASALESGCHNYYHSESGRNVTQWPGNQYLHWLVSRVLPHVGFTYRSRSSAG